MNIQTIINSIKKNKNTRRCYHPLAGSSCGKFMSAHSIQEAKELKSIINKKSKVIQISSSVNQYNIYKAEEVGKGVVSTFFGFCEPHDNHLFRPIDAQTIIPTNEQAFLLAYRSICKELFNKENGVNILLDSIEECQNDLLNAQLKNVLLGNKVGLDSLQKHKNSFDNEYLTSSFSDVRHYTLFFDSEPILHFSGLTYPDCNFEGKAIQNILSAPSMLTFSSVLTDNGWAIVFSWLKGSSSVCEQFINSLENCLFKGENLTDLLFNFILKSCENVVFSPSWWNYLSENLQNGIIDIVKVRDSNFIATTTDKYINIEVSISDWSYIETKSNCGGI
jgi:hypothetical protein